MDNLFGSICLSDIPRELIHTNEKNGKKYLTVVINERRTPSNYGYTHYIKAYAKKGEAPEGVNLYIGELKASQYGSNSQSQQQPQSPVPPVPQSSDDDLPF